MTFKQLSIFVFAFVLISPSLFGQQGISEAEKNEALFIDATMLLVLDKYEEANKIFLGLLKDDKTNSTLNFQISRCFLGLNNKNEGLEYARKAVLNDKKNTFYYEYLIDLLLEEGMLEEASIYAKDLSVLEPQKDLYFTHWMSILSHREEYDQVLDAIDLRINDLGSSPDLLLKRAGTLLKLGKPKKAENTLLSAVDDFPKESEIPIQLIAFYLDQGNPQQIKSSISKFKNTFPDKINMLVEIPGIGIYLDDNNSSSSNPLVSVIRSDQFSLDQKIKEIIPLLTNFVEGNDQEAKILLNELITILEDSYPSDPKVQSIKGDIHFYSNEYNTAIIAYENCLSVRKNLLAVWDHLLFSYLNDGQTKKLLERSDDALLYFPNQSIIWYYYCLGLIENHKYEDAIYEIDSYEYLINGNLQQILNASILKARAYLGLGQIDKGIKEIEAAETIQIEAGIKEPNRNPYLDIYKLILLAEDKANNKEALKLSKQLESYSNNALYQYAKAKCLVQNNDLETALQSIEFAIASSYPNPADFFELKGDILLEKGDLILAKEAFQIAIEKNGNVDRINTKLNRLN
jgi:tetratricopeptide (TPR) repeat protein